MRVQACTLHARANHASSKGSKGAKISHPRPLRQAHLTGKRAQAPSSAKVHAAAHTHTHAHH
eukprot:3863137-Prymnesium_polylepis.2